MNTHLLSCHEAEEQFKAAIVQAGFNPPPIVAGKFIRFAGLNKPSHNRSAWCHLFDDYQAGVFGDWSTGYQETWRANHRQALTQEEKRQYAKQAQAAREQAEKDRQAKQQLVAKQAQELWRSLPQANKDHPYLTNKGLTLADGLKIEGSWLLVPLVDIATNKLVNFQRIAPDGKKLFLKGGQISEVACPIGLQEPPIAGEVLYICEGYATGVTLHQITAKPILAAMNAGNLLAVAKAAKKRWPDLNFVIAGDDDYLTYQSTGINPGADKAAAAAIAIKAKVSYPPFTLEQREQGLTDWNDYYLAKQLDEVAV